MLAKHVVGVPVPRSEFAEIAEVVRWVPQQRLRQRTDKKLEEVPVLQPIVVQSMDVFAAQFMEENVEVFHSVLRGAYFLRCYMV